MRKKNTTNENAYRQVH